MGQLTVWVWLYIRSWPGCLMQTRLERKLPIGWECRVLSWTGEVVYPSRTGPAVQAGHPSHDGVCVPHMEVHCPQPRRQAASVTVQVSAPCYRCTLVHCNRQIYKDLGVPFFANHIRALTKSDDSNSANMRQSGQYLRWSRVDQVQTGQSRPPPSQLNKLRAAIFSWAPFGQPDWGFSVIFPHL